MITVNANQRHQAASPGHLSLFTNILRKVGVVSVVLAAVIFMVQGLEDASLHLRQWTWLILMGGMAGGGVICRFLFNDVKSARIFFALAAAIVPVQFSQLGGMLFQLVADVSQMGLPFNQLKTLSSFWLGVDIFVSLALAVGLAYTCFSILVRSASKITTIIFVLLNFSMLLPFRDSIFAIMVLALTPTAMFWLESKVFRLGAEYKTLESYVLRMLLSIPMLIMAVRNSFHMDTLVGFCALGAIISLMFVYVVAKSSEKYWVHESALAVGGGLAFLSWATLCSQLFFENMDIVFLLPLALLTLELSRLSWVNKKLYINLACMLVVVLGVFTSFVEPTLGRTVFGFTLGLSVAAGGVVTEKKFPLIAGGVVALIAAVMVVVLSISHVSFNSWFVLAIGGSVLLLCSGAIERYGKFALVLCRRVQAYD